VPLRPKHARFVAEYLTDLNGTAAAIRAGYSPKTARQTAVHLQALPAVRDAIRDRAAAQVAKINLSADRTLAELATLATSDLADALDPATGALLPLHLMPLRIRRAIASIKITKQNRIAGDGKTEDVVEVKLWNKVHALELLAKHFRLISDTVELTPSQELTDLLRAGRARVSEAAKAKTLNAIPVTEPIKTQQLAPIRYDDSFD
jgi:phage terminase small subunit